MDRAKYKEVLEIMQEVSELSGVRFFADFGTLLGLIRDKGPIEHDKDIDFSAMASEHAPVYSLVRHLLEARGCRYVRCFGLPDCGWELTYNYKGINVDIFHYYPYVGDSDYMWAGIWKDGHLLQQIRPVADTVTYDYEGVTVHIPDNYERQLHAQYGPDWKTPDKKWHWANSPRATKKLALRATPPKAVQAHIESLPPTSVYPGRLADMVTVVIKTFKRDVCLDRLLDSCRRFLPGLPVIVADDSARQELPLQDKYPEVDFVKLPFNVGVSAGRNAAVDKVGTPYMLLFDDDFVVSPLFNLPRCLDKAMAYDIDILGLGLCGGSFMCSVVEIKDGTYRDHQRAARKILEPGLYECDKVYQNFLAKTDTIRAVRWDDRLKTDEHSDFFLRTQKAGTKVAAYLHQSVVHKQHLPRDYKKYRKAGQKYVRISGETHGFSNRVVIPNNGIFTGDLYD